MKMEETQVNLSQKRESTSTKGSRCAAAQSSRTVVKTFFSVSLTHFSVISWLLGHCRQFIGYTASLIVDSDGGCQGLQLLERLLELRRKRDKNAPWLN